MASSVLADEILESMEKIDEFQKMIGEAQKKIAVAKEEFAKVQDGVRQESTVLEVEFKRLEGLLKAAEAELPEDFQVDYFRVVKSKGADAMAEVQNGFCGGCYQQLTPNNIAELSMSRAIFCRNCGRVIYLPEDTRPSAATQVADFFTRPSGSPRRAISCRRALRSNLYTASERPAGARMVRNMLACHRSALSSATADARGLLRNGHIL